MKIVLSKCEYEAFNTSIIALSGMCMSRTEGVCEIKLLSNGYYEIDLSEEYTSMVFDVTNKYLPIIVPSVKAVVSTCKTFDSELSDKEREFFLKIAKEKKKEEKYDIK